MLGHMTGMDSPLSSADRVCYLPHHGVYKNTDPSPKLHVVFNKSARLAIGGTLNQHLMVGSNLIPLLADVLLRWRRHHYVFVSDVEKMFRQIWLHPEDRDLQQILCREQENRAVSEYGLNTVTYNLSYAPYLETRTLRQLVEDEGARYPLGAAMLRRDVYVDDVLFGADTLLEVKRARDKLVRISTTGGFPLRKWAANSEAILEASWENIEPSRRRCPGLQSRPIPPSDSSGTLARIGFISGFEDELRRRSPGERCCLPRRGCTIRSGCWHRSLYEQRFLSSQLGFCSFPRTTHFLRERSKNGGSSNVLYLLEQLRVQRWLSVASSSDASIEITASRMLPRELMLLCIYSDWRGRSRRTNDLSASQNPSPFEADLASMSRALCCVLVHEVSGPRS